MSDDTTGISEIFPGLWVGGTHGIPSAKAKGLRILGVREEARDPEDDEWVPILVGDRLAHLAGAADIIELFLRSGQGIFVHCDSGRDRAPLLVAWFLTARAGHTMDSAYALVQDRHPPTRDRRAWIDGPAPVMGRTEDPAPRVEYVPVLEPPGAVPAAAAGFIGSPPTIVIGPGNPESEKYFRMWTHPEYRKDSPGEQLVPTFLNLVKPRPGASVIDFGCGTGRGGLLLALLGGLDVTLVDFVHNSLDDDIRPILEAQKHAFRFVKADLVTGPLPTGEYGFCCDVLEHIPPDQVDAVLNNILTAARHVFISVSTGPDTCGELIGERLHLTVQPYAWWLEKFQARGCQIHWSSEADNGAAFYVTAWVTGHVISEAGVMNVTEATALANIRHNTGVQADGGKWQQVNPYMGRSEDEVMILGAGPTLAEFESEIIAKRRMGIKIVTLNGAYGWALERGLGPVTQVVMDARPFNARFVQPIREDCVYLIASQCDPSVLVGLPYARTLLWHTMVDLSRDVLKEHYPEGWIRILGGSTVLLRAIPLLAVLGHRRFTLYGCDSCLIDQQHHAFAQPENDGVPVIAVLVTTDGRAVTRSEGEGRVFYCNPWMIAQANQLVEFLQSPLSDEIELDIKGDGLLAHIIRVASDAHDRAGMLA